MSRFWDNPNYIELKPGWWILKTPGERFVGGLPVHPHDPIFTPIFLSLGASSTTAATLSTATTIAGVATAGGLMAYSAYQQGEQQAEDAKKAAKARAEIERQNAEKAKQAAAREAQLEEEEGQKLLQRQQVLFSASGVRSDVGAPLVIKAQTKRDIAMQKSFILEEGRDVAESYGLQADYDIYEGRVKARQARRQGNWDMWTTILSTGATVGMMGYQAGWFSNTPKTTIAGTGSKGLSSARMSNWPISVTT